MLADECHEILQRRASLLTAEPLQPRAVEANDNSEMLMVSEGRPLTQIPPWTCVLEDEMAAICLSRKYIQPAHG